MIDRCPTPARALLTKHLIVARAQVGMSRTQALDHLRNRHALLVSAASNLRRSLKRYVQNPVIEAGTVTLACDWIVEAWYDESIEFVEPPREDDVLAVREDLQTFVDMAGLLRLRVFEAPIFGDRASGVVRLFSFVKRRSGCSADDFRAAWYREGSELVSARRAAGMSMHVQNYPLRAAAADAGYDVIDAFGFACERDASRFVERALHLPLSFQLCDESRPATVIARAHSIFDDFDQARISCAKSPVGAIQAG
ncbi:MAG TPA: hypothetical protein VGE08_15260 [Steroidobacter sp.]|uniref:hypothetical protein n=1 Tax=Steroidobacter sp. TaxID=1978227 RepID=UPI002ED9E302